ncbi:MAG: 50S ribosomal protein L35 [Candidatus Cloacimonetes bacterium]|nr:50S ribosomal protein L35 [Candidatus Cloacimonadota bacterium]MBL7108528.1 50S ribosomal protein L35 [Candidatus Cloacimonadota bacterium]
MPKIKTRKSASKRFSKTAKGKIKRNKAYRNHFMTKKSKKQKNNLRKGGLIAHADEKRVKKMLGS